MHIRIYTQSCDELWKSKSQKFSLFPLTLNFVVANHARRAMDPNNPKLCTLNEKGDCKQYGTTCIMFKNLLAHIDEVHKGFHDVITPCTFSFCLEIRILQSHFIQCHEAKNRHCITCGVFSLYPK